MNNDLQIIIAFIFRRSGRSVLSASDIYLPLSMELNWYSITDSKNLVKHAIEKNILKKEGELLRPNFDYINLKIPVGFSPSKDILQQEGKIKSIEIEDDRPDLLKRIVEKISKKSGEKNEDILKNIEKISKEKNIFVEVAALLECKDYDIDFNEFLSDIEKSLF
jgi:hypothetical protein